jgi:hypothetical protein
MMIVAALCLFAGLILAFNANIRMFILVAAVIFASAFAAGMLEGSFLRGLGWAFTGVVAVQVGYILMIVARAAWSVALARSRQPVAY